MEIYLDYAKVALAFASLLYASWSDWRRREVTNSVWIILAPVGLTLSLIQLYQAYSAVLLWVMLISIAFVSVIGFLLFFFGFVGGADSKAFICLALTFPWQPVLGNPALKLSLPLFPVSILTNSVILSVTAIFLVLAENIAWKLKGGEDLYRGFEHESAGRKIVSFFTSFKVSRVKLKASPHFNLAEETKTCNDGTVKRFFKISMKDLEMDERLNVEKLPEYIWVTPRIPMTIFITLGLLTALLFGDILIGTISSLLR